MTAPLPDHDTSDLRQSVYTEVARVAQALANPRRLTLLELLAQGERTVDALARESGLTLANTSQHLQELRRAGLVVGRKDGAFVRCSLRAAEVNDLVHALTGYAERHGAEIQRLQRERIVARDGLEPVRRHELLARVRAGLAVVVDVRPTAEFLAGHIPGAVSIPLPELEDRLRDLPRDQMVVAYCRGPWCVLAVAAVEQLRRHGIAARRLQDGWPEWRAAGLPVAVGGEGAA